MEVKKNGKMSEERNLIHIEEDIYKDRLSILTLGTYCQ